MQNDSSGIVVIIYGCISTRDSSHRRMADRPRDCSGDNSI